MPIQSEPSKPSSVPFVRCPACATPDDKVIDSRTADDGSAIRRRRECLACERRFTTYETVEQPPLVIVTVVRLKSALR